MLGIGLPEILLIAFLLLVVVGPERLPQFMRSAGRTYGKIRRTADEMRRAFVLEADRLDEEERRSEREERRRRAEAERLRVLESAGIGTVDQQPARPAPPPAPAVEVIHSAPAEPEEPPPPGIGSEEWRELPEHIRAMLRDRAEGRGGSGP